MHLPRFLILAGKCTKCEHLVADSWLRGTPPGSSFVLMEKDCTTDKAYEKYVCHLISQLTCYMPESVTLGFTFVWLITIVTSCCWMFWVNFGKPGSKNTSTLLPFLCRHDQSCNPLDITCFWPDNQVAGLEQGILAIRKRSVPGIASGASQPASLRKYWKHQFTRPVHHETPR